jgi:hypothetical protein
MSATAQARIVRDANEMAHSNAMSARDQARFTPTEAARFRIQARMNVASVTCDLGEYERLAQGSLGTCSDTSTATSGPRSMFNGRLGRFSRGCPATALLRSPAPIEQQITARFSADTSQIHFALSKAAVALSVRRRTADAQPSWRMHRQD